MLRFLSLILVFLFSIQTYSAHFRGGEITWQCVESGTSKGKIIFTVKLWRNCASSTAGLPTTASIINPLFSQFGGVSIINCSRIAQNDISPSCVSPINEIACGAFGVAGTQAYEENVYVSPAVQINGTPAATGSEFYYSTCCRANTVNGASNNFYLRAVMFPYVDPVSNQYLSLGSTSSGATCYDNSAVFAEKVPYLGVADKFNYFTIKSIDVDCDSLNYAFADPKSSATTINFWNSGYSKNSPLPGVSVNTGNVQATMDNKTGITSYKVIGGNNAYQMCHMVASYRDGQKVSEVYRDYTSIIAQNSTDFYSIANQNPSIFFKLPLQTSYATSYSDTFDVGQTVLLNILATDGDYNDSLQKQNVSLRLVADLAVDATFNPFGCKFSNCAKLDTNSANWVGGKFESTDSVTANFEWVIDCEHLVQCQASSMLNKEYLTYTFQVVAMDDNCDKPLSTIKSFSITIRDTLIDDSPIREISYSGDSALITWEKLVSPQFISYNLYRMNLSQGVYVLLDSITNINDTSFVDTLGFDSIGVRYRLIPHVGFSCDNQNNTYDAIILHADSVSGVPQIAWNSMYKMGGSGNYGYYLLQSDTGTGWFTLDSSASNSYTHSNPGCATLLKYRVLAFDTVNDVHYVSNIDSVIQDNAPKFYPFEVCNGDSILLAGAYRKTAGTFTDSTTNQFGCKLLIHNELTINPVYNITNSQTSICNGDSIMLAGAYRDSAGIYNQAFITDKGCDSIHNFPLKVNTVDVSVSRLSNTLTANLKNKVYQWLECPSMTPIPSANLATYTAAQNGSYAVVVTDGLCSDTSDCHEINGISIDEYYNGNTIKTFPNPVTNQITIQIKNDKFRAGLKLEIYSSIGQSVYLSEILSTIHGIDISSWSEGVYYYVLKENNEMVYNASFIKE